MHLSRFYSKIELSHKFKEVYYNNHIVSSFSKVQNSEYRIQKHISMIFHDQQCNFHDYLMHGIQPHLHHAEHKWGMQQQQHACRLCMHFEIIKT